MKLRKYFRDIIHKKYPELCLSLMNEIDERYSEISFDTKFAKKSSNPLDKRLDSMAYFLALILTLHNNQFEFEEIRQVSIEVANDYVKPKNQIDRWLKQLPPKLIHMPLAKKLLRLMDTKVSTKGHENGFLAKVITDKEKTYGLGYGIDILECGICKLFRKYNAEKYTSILCEVDKITSNLAGLELVREGTIANGNDKCDFRFKRINTNHNA